MVTYRATEISEISKISNHWGLADAYQSVRALSSVAASHTDSLALSRIQVPVSIDALLSRTMYLPRLMNELMLLCRHDSAINDWRINVLHLLRAPFVAIRLETCLLLPTPQPCHPMEDSE